MFKHPDPMRLALKTSCIKNFSNRLTFGPSPQRPQSFGLENALIRRFSKALNSNTAPHVVLANVDETLFNLY